jgi:hypothetical protein
MRRKRRKKRTKNDPQKSKMETKKFKNPSIAKEYSEY